jgi:hypothetical protein
MRGLGRLLGCHVAEERDPARGEENKIKHTCYHCALSAKGREVSDQLEIK